MSSSNHELVTYADLQDGPLEHIDRIQQIFGCSMEAARMAYYGFELYIPHMWVGTKTHPDGRLKGEGLVYGVMRNLGLGFLTKTTEGKKAINITLRKGENGKRDHQSCKIHFDRLFTRGEENAGNIAILEHLLGGKTNERTGRDVYNHLEVIYQEAGPNRYTGNDDPARFWKVFLWRPAPETEKPASPAPASPRVRFTLVTARDNSLPNSAAPVTRRVHFPTPAESVTPPATAPAPSFEEQQLAEDGFTTVGRGGGTAN